MKKFNKDKYLKQLQLKRFYRKYERYFYIGIPCLLVAILGIYFAYSKFTTTSDTEVVRTTVGDFIQGDIILTPYIDGTYSKTFPKDELGYNVEKVTCDNGATGEWDSFNWKLKVTGMTKRTKCNVYFVTPASCGINDNVSCINSREGLATLATEVNNGDTKSGKIYYLTSDIDLGGKFDSNGNALDGSVSWTPIGTESNPFSGTFDGNAHIISNMYVNRLNDNDNGLFGNGENSIIKNIGIKSSYIIGKIGNGAIIGQNGTVKNSYSLTNIKGEGRSGGICGSRCDIKNSYNGGIINNGSTALAAGIAGGWNKVVNSYNYGNITSNGDSVGGILGWNGSVYNSYNLGIVTTTNNNHIDSVGGILGQSADTVMNTKKIQNVLFQNYNAGSCNGGGILGVEIGVSDYKNITTNLKENYFLAKGSEYGIKAYQSNDGASPIEASQMPSVISVINGDNAFVEDTNNINNGYPILKWQAERENN